MCVCMCVCLCAGDPPETQSHALTTTSLKVVMMAVVAMLAVVVMMAVMVMARVLRCDGA